MGQLKEAPEQKQAEQEGVDGVTVPIKTEKPDNAFGNPHLEQAMQTNVLLGQLIGEMQKLQAMVLQQQAGQTEDDKVNETEETKTEVNESDDSESANLSEDKLTDKLGQEEQASAKAFVASSKRYLDRLDKRLKQMGV